MVAPTGHKGMQQMFLEYEVSSSIFAPLVWWGWGQELCASYFAWKVRKKYSRYLECIRIKRGLQDKMSNNV